MESGCLLTVAGIIIYTGDDSKDFGKISVPLETYEFRE